MHCIVPFACRYAFNVARQRQRCQPLPIFLATRRISFAKRSTRNFDATFCCTNAGLSLGNSTNLATLYRECLEKDDTREGGFIWRESRVEKSSSLNGRILIFENMFFERGCEKYIRFFFWKCHVSRWTRQGFYFQDNRVCNRIFIFFRRILIGILRALFRFEEDLYKIKNKYIYIYI